ncbi:MAG: hypothetical protein ACLPUT_07920 [Solirubrobacteraceae bacterium]|jgi:hypothetical protein
MRRVRIVLGLAVAVCAFGALAGPAFAKKPKLIFGHFAASIVGRHISPTETAKVVENKEEEAEVTGLHLGKYKFGVLNSENKPEFGEPCEESPKVTGVVSKEESSSLLLNVDFRKCVTSTREEEGTTSAKISNIKLSINFKSNESGELGNSEGGIEIAEKAVILVKGVGNCVVEIPAQTVPAKAAEKEEKFWEGAEYEDENEEPVENWEKSRKLKEQYPGDVRERLNVVTTEKFKGILSYVHPFKKGTKECLPTKGEENGKLVTEKEIEVEGKMVANPYYGDLEYRNGRIDVTVNDLEIKGGQLTFVAPPEEA